jgi:hypothetical protein
VSKNSAGIGIHTSQACARHQRHPRWRAGQRLHGEDLCDRIYPEAILVEMKHRVAVLRAAGKVMSRRAHTGVMVSEGLGGTKVYYNRDNVQSYAMARLKTYHRYRTGDLRHYWSVDEADLRKQLADERHQELVAEGGAWHGYVQEFIAERDGDLARLKRLKAAARKRSARAMANLVASVGGRARP